MPMTRCTPFALFSLNPDRAAPGAPASKPIVPPSLGVTFSVCSSVTVTSAPESMVARATVGLSPTALEKAMSAVSGSSSAMTFWPSTPSCWRITSPSGSNSAANSDASPLRSTSA
jgi:hypothetical protein